MNNNYKKKIVFFFLIISFFLIKADFIFALETEYPPVLGMTITNESSFPEYAKYFFNIGMAIAGLLAVVVIVFGGIYYLISLGREQFTDEGKSWIKAGILGLLLTVSAYLIAYTINPALIDFRLQRLFFLGLFDPSRNNFDPSAKMTVYQEIPLGILTESLLTKKIDCYGFDARGDPILGEERKTDDNRNVYDKTYQNHERVDCFLKLGKAIEKKSQLIAVLAEKIAGLMQQCNCSSNDNCKDNCSNSICKYSDTGKCPLDEKEMLSKKLCEDTCTNTPCKCSENENCDLCPAGVKDQIEQGLNQFRTEIEMSDIISFVETDVRVEVNNDRGEIVSYEKIKIIDHSKWSNLKLIEQLMYLK